MIKRITNGKSNTPNQTATDSIPNDDNWKLLKFLCDRIEENKKKEQQAAKQTTESPAPIPITGNILAKRKKKKKKNKTSFITNKLKLTTSPRSNYSNHSNHSTQSADRLHSKTQSQALYTSAFKYNINSPTRTSNANAYNSNSPYNSSLYTPHTNTNLPPVSSNNKLDHKKSQSTQLPSKYNHNHPNIDSPHTSSSDDASTPSNTVMIHNNQSMIDYNSTQSNTSQPTDNTNNTNTNINTQNNNNNNNNIKFALALDYGQSSNDNMDDEFPLNDPVQSLVTLVRRVTQIYTKNQHENETEVSDQETIRRVYDKYVEFYDRHPVYPDHLRKFANKFQGIHVTYASAKEYLDSVQAIQIVTSPKQSTLNQPKLMRFSRSSISSPLLIPKDINKAIQNENEEKDSNNNTIKISTIINQDGHDEKKNNRNNKRPSHDNLYTFYNLTDVELLQRIKKKINVALRSKDDTFDMESAIHMIWEREYNELEKRLHRAYVNANTAIGRTALNGSTNTFGSLSLAEIKRDTTYKSLKQMSLATDIDDTDHDAAVYLLKTYFPDDDDDDEYSSMANNREYYDHTHSVSLLTHRIQKSNIGPTIHDTGTANKLKIKPQQQHIRSVTADKERKPALYRRATTRTPNAHTEALSLYDTMVMKARQSKIKNKGKQRQSQNNKLHMGIPIAGALKKNKSAPTQHSKNDMHAYDNKENDILTLETIPSQDTDNTDDMDNNDAHVIQEYDISPANMTWKQQYHQPFRLEDDDIILQSELTPEPPLFDMAFRQLTTTSHGQLSQLTSDDDTYGYNILDIATASGFSKQSTANQSGSTSTSDTNTDRESMRENHKDTIALNLLDIMSKYGHKMDRWDFDVFEFMDDPSLCGKGLVCASFFLFRKIGLLDATGVSQANLWRFLENVAMGYLSNPYHNTYHAVDVLLSTHYMFQSSFFKKHMTIWDQFGTYIAAVCHDLGHMGLNNAYYINTAGNLALLYGDDSVLENYHIAETFRILNNMKHNWMLSFPSSVRRYLATVIRRTILATDLKVHGTKMMQLQNMIDVFRNSVNLSSHDSKANQHELFANNISLWRCESIANYASLDNIMLDDFKLFMDEKLNKEWTRDIVIKDLDMEADNNDEENSNNQYDQEVIKKPRILGVDDERIFLLEITIHACDVANPCKPIHLAKEWANRYLREAFNQGDQERNIGIPVSAGMDRYTSKLPTSQIGFITFIVKRLFQLYSELIDVSQNCFDIMLQNEQYWIQEKRKMNEKKNNNNNKQPLSNLGTINE